MLWVRNNRKVGSRVLFLTGRLLPNEGVAYRSVEGLNGVEAQFYAAEGNGNKWIESNSVFIPLPFLLRQLPLCKTFSNKLLLFLLSPFLFITTGRRTLKKVRVTYWTPQIVSLPASSSPRYTFWFWAELVGRWQQGRTSRLQKQNQFHHPPTMVSPTYLPTLYIVDKD